MASRRLARVGIENERSIAVGRLIKIKHVQAGSGEGVKGSAGNLPKLPVVFGEADAVGVWIKLPP